MNKATKGALAAAAAAAILAGGAGTMAAWNSTAPGTGGGTITAGSMTVTQQPDTGGWAWADGTPIADITTIKIVPGQSVKYTAIYNVELIGTNLKADLVPTLGGVTGELAA
ncbi:MAG: alternate-type signal peptide domain-containing protein, partial [Gordonia sp. (in: high G+C Gram-positive bacteria)]